jgi:hypothetical protein
MTYCQEQDFNADPLHLVVLSNPICAWRFHRCLFNDKLSRKGLSSRIPRCVWSLYLSVCGVTDAFSTTNCRERTFKPNTPLCVVFIPICVWSHRCLSMTYCQEQVFPPRANVRHECSLPPRPFWHAPRLSSPVTF